MKLYHGSKAVIANPIVQGSKCDDDYGPSFYLTTDLNTAKSWACKENVLGIVNEYICDSKVFRNFKILDLTNKDLYSVLNWVAILMHFRILDSSFKKNNIATLKWLEKYFIDVDQYDIVIGFRADDSWFRFPSRFVSNDLAFEDLEKVFLLGNLGIQYAFMSKRAIKSLKFNSAIECERTYLGNHQRIVKEATKIFDEILNSPRDPNKTYILDLMRKSNE